LKEGELAPCGHIANLLGSKGDAIGAAAQETPARIVAHSAA
jgi:hypothetical protein